MTTLTEFLLARIAEDEVVARAGGSITTLDWEFANDAEPSIGCIGMTIASVEQPALGPHIARHDPARVLAECAAKRQIVELHHRVRDLIEMENLKRGPTWGCVCYGGWPCATIRALATVYADHPDFRAEWAL